MATIAEREAAQVAEANASGRVPVVFVRGLWLLPSSWEPWAQVFRGAGYAPLIPGWPDDPATVNEARAHPEVLANKRVGRVADHFSEIIHRLDRKPAVVGHSIGGLVAQILAGRGDSAATVAVDPAPGRGILPLPISALRSVLPVLRNPLNVRRAVAFTPKEFRYAFANAVSEEEAETLYDTFAVAGAGVPIFQAALANVNPWSETRVNRKNPARGPMLILSGEKDHAIPWAVANAAYKKQRRNEGVTEIKEIPNRGHALTIDSGWREVAETALEFVKRFV